jgi:hypothetical protein
MVFKNLTGYETDTLPQSDNLTDGHAFRRWFATEEAIIDRSAQPFKNSNRRRQFEIEREYIRDFSRLAKQMFDDNALGYLMCFTASMAFEIIANYLRLNHLSLALIEPCFDNLADIFRRHQIPLRPFPDTLLEAPPDAFERALHTIDSNAICLVTPNNPAGLALAQSNLRSLVRFCKEHHKLLILDNCFRVYLPRQLVYDQYRFVLEAGLDAVLVEDTGKTWPTSEIKAPFFAAPRETQFMDPQQRQLLEVHWEPLESAGIVPQRLSGQQVAFLSAWGRPSTATCTRCSGRWGPMRTTAPAVRTPRLPAGSPTSSVSGAPRWRSTPPARPRWCPFIWP